MQTNSRNGSHVPRAASPAAPRAVSTASPDFPIAIIGCGFSGIGTAIQLKAAGILSFTIFERADEIGGTWRDNTYPGAACDVPSHVYSFSFEPNPDWSSKFAGSAEIQKYLLGCVDKYDLRPHLRLNTAITDAVFDEEQGVWTLTTDGGEQFRARAVVSAMGGLVDPSYPDIKGLESFQGETIHSARWKHDYDLAGKRVGVIGTGASGIQVIPAIAARVAELSVFQRTPAWVLPRGEKTIREDRKARYRRYPFLMRLVRWAQFWFSELMGPIVMLDSPRLSSLPESISRKHLERSVSSPELREKLTPDFQFGCKRILISDDYLSTFERDNVRLITDGITEIRPGGIVTDDGVEHELDAIVYATGFDVAFTAPRIPIAGLGGRTVAEIWQAEGPSAYKGMTVAGIPNWFIIMGPNTGPGHTSVLIYTEAQIRYIVKAIKKLIAENIRYLTVRRAVQARYNERLQGRMKYTVWQSGCKSWYLDADGSNHALFPGFASEYRARIRRFKESDYDIVTFDSTRRSTETAKASGSGDDDAVVGVTADGN
jgi:cation diffusion facilitator CzcD-associated flavoprotein CzcO